MWWYGSNPSVLCKATDLLGICLCTHRNSTKTAWCWRLRCPGTACTLKMARVGSELKQWIYIYFLLLLTHLLRGREFVTCSVFPALHRLSLPLFLHILQPVCIGLMRSLLHPLNSQGLWNAYTLYIHKKAFSYKWQEKWRPHTQRGGGRGHSLYKEHILQLPLQSLPFYPMLRADQRSPVSDNYSKNQISPQGRAVTSTLVQHAEAWLLRGCVPATWEGRSQSQNQHN